MNRIALLAVAASLTLAACAHKDTTPDSRVPLGATELQGTGTPATVQTTDVAPKTTASSSSRDDSHAVATTATNPPPPAADVPPSRPEVVSTRVNRRDPSKPAAPMAQGNNATDLGITRTIRMAVMADTSLSSAARSVKVITRGSKVVLRGAVKTPQESASIDAKARATVGVTEVDDQMEVKP